MLNHIRSLENEYVRISLYLVNLKNDEYVIQGTIL
jgi:hypothetical protein